jgi:hypothetical protein
VGLRYVKEVVAFRYSELVFLAFLVDECYVQSGRRVKPGPSGGQDRTPGRYSLFARLRRVNMAV